MKAKFEQNKLVIDIKDNLVASRLKGFFENAEKYAEQKENYHELILNLGDVKIIDSIGLSFIISLFKTVSKLDRRFRIVGTNKDIRQLFQIMKLDQVIEIESA